MLHAIDSFLQNIKAAIAPAGELKSQRPVGWHVWASNGLQQEWGIQKCKGWDEKKLFWTSGEASRSFKAQRPGHTHHTPVKHPFLSPSGSQHMLGTSPSGSLPFTEAPATPTLSITSKNTAVEVYKSQADAKCGLSLCTAAWALTYRVHAVRNPAWILMPQLHKPLGQQRASLQRHTATEALQTSLATSSWTNSPSVWCLFELSEVLIIFTHQLDEIQLFMADYCYCWPTALCCQALTTLFNARVTVWSRNSQPKHKVMS